MKTPSPLHRMVSGRTFSSLMLAASLMTGCATHKLTQVPPHESHLHLTAEQRAAVCQALHRHSGRGMHVTPNIPATKLANARLACVAPAEEEILALVDSTVTGNAKHSLLIGTSGIYVHNDWAGNSPGRQFVPYQDFLTARIDKDGWFEVSVGSVSFNTSGCSISKAAVIALLTDVQLALAKSEPRNSPLESRLKELKSLYEKGLLTPEEFEAKRKSMLNDL